MNNVIDNITDTITNAIDSDAMNEKLRGLWREAQRVAKDYPVPALIGAVVVGFAAGRLLRRG